jgi:ribosome maturation factor RimP
MRQVPANLQDLIEPAVIALGYELVGIEYLPQGKHSLLRVYIDHEDGIMVEDCSKVSHQLSGLLDVEDVVNGQYNLEISSPGLDRPLFTPQHFERFTGCNVKLKLSIPFEGSSKYRGLLCGIEDETVVINVDGNEIALPFDIIDKANLVPNI